LSQVAILGGLGAALCWGIQQALSSRAARRSHPLIALVALLSVGLAAALPVAISQGIPSATASHWAFATLAAIADLCGLGLIFLAFQKGPLSLVAPLASAQGGAATLISVVLGERLSMLDLLGLGLVTTGMVVVLSHQYRHRQDPTGEQRFTSVLQAMGSCLAIGVALYSLGQSATALGTPWTLVVLKAVGLMLLAITLRIRGFLVAPRRILPLILPAGILDNLGFASFLAGTAAGGLAVPAVLGSQFSVVAAVIGVVLFDERLSRIQALGLGTVIVGVAVLAAQT